MNSLYSLLEIVFFIQNHVIILHIMELDILGFPLIGFVLKSSEYAYCYGCSKLGCWCWKIPIFSSGSQLWKFFYKVTHSLKLCRFLCQQIYVSYACMFNFVVLFFMVELLKIVTYGCCKSGNCFPEFQKLKRVTVGLVYEYYRPRQDFIMKFQSFLCL